MHRHIETLQRDLPPRSSSSFELTALADKDSHAETYMHVAETAEVAGAAGAARGRPVRKTDRGALAPALAPLLKESAHRVN